MSIVDNFIKRYLKEFDYYQELSRLCAQQCENGLEALGIRSIVTYRAKRPGKLEKKVRERDKSKNFASVEAIFDDIVDLAGVRIALYFPADRDEVKTFVLSTFNLVRDPKEFPENSSSVITKYSKRFSGYWATHYRVNLRKESLSDSQIRYSDGKIEIQVASVLMHAWAEVEHDLVYKPESGKLSEDEYAILDELNGLVISGEIALERLQRALHNRVNQQTTKFQNHYELASFLYEIVKKSGISKEETPGDINILFKLLEAAKLNTPQQLSTLIKNISIDAQNLPVTQQLIDKIIYSNETLYKKYLNLRKVSEFRNPYRKAPDKQTIQQINHAIGFFMSQWIILEKALQQIGNLIMPKPVLYPMRPKRIEELKVFDARQLKEYERLRIIRNQLVHGIERPSALDLDRDGQVIKDLLEALKDHGNSKIQKIVRKLLRAETS